MPLQIKEGDLLANAKAPCLIIHGCNAQGKMKAGFADKLRNMYPQAYKVYRDHFNVHGLAVGTATAIKTSSGVYVANLVTQEFYGRDPDVVYVDYTAVETTCTEAAEFCAKAENLPLHLPFIGGGLANGDREKLMEIFERVFTSTDATLWIY